MRAAAFAEIQAREAFRWAASRFEDAPAEARRAWLALAHAEEKHLNWLLKRMEELGIAIDARPVSDQLWQSFVRCETAETFSWFMASAEERGRKAGERFRDALLQTDPVTARIFGQIALEEIDHIALATRYFGYSPEKKPPDAQRPVLPNPPAPR